jgi:hypothetical protein
MRKPIRDRSPRLRRAVDALPRRTRVAMLEGIDRNRIIVGAYTDPRSGGVCPMLAAHRNGGRTDLASFARAWDAFTAAKRARLASRREVAALRAQLEMSLLADEPIAAPDPAISAHPKPPSATRDGGGHNRTAELRDRLRWAWMRPARRYDEFKDLVATAEGQLAEQRAAEVLGDRPAPHLRQGAG